MIQKANQTEQKKPSVGIESVDNDTIGAISIGLNQMSLDKSGAGTADTYGTKDGKAMRADFMNSSSKKISNLTQSASDSDSNSDEENDKVMHMQEDHSAFRQLDYLWLFNNELKFMDRPDF